MRTSCNQEHAFATDIPHIPSIFSLSITLLTFLLLSACSCAAIIISSFSFFKQVRFNHSQGFSPLTSSLQNTYLGVLCSYKHFLLQVVFPPFLHLRYWSRSPHFTLLRIWSHLLKKSVMENFIFCAVSFSSTSYLSLSCFLKLLTYYYYHYYYYYYCYYYYYTYYFREFENETIDK